MQTVALHTRLKAGSEEEYERIHKMIPPDLDAALREVGYTTGASGGTARTCFTW